MKASEVTFKLEEFVTVKITPPNQKRRKEMDLWNRDASLRSAVEKCLETQEEQFVFNRGEFALFHIRPSHPVVETRRNEPEYKNLLAVSISVLYTSFHLVARAIAVAEEEEKRA